MLLWIVLPTMLSVEVWGQMPCHDANDCPGPLFDCKENLCICERSICDVPKVPGDKCLIDADCFSSQLMCYGKGEVRACRCKKMYTYDMKFNRCLKDDSYVYDPVQNFIIPAIIVMSVGAMVYLGVKLFCNCGKMWRRRQSELTRDLETMTGMPHQQPTWIASYRVFSQISNSNQHTLHPAPCMGLFVPSLNTSPPPYEEALKHKVILSSVSVPAPVTEPPPHLSSLPAYPFEPPPPIEDCTLQASSRLEAPERDQTRTLHYYPGEGNPQIPALWNSGCEMVETHNAHLSNTEGAGAVAAVDSRPPSATIRAARTMPRPRRYVRPNQPP